VTSSNKNDPRLANSTTTPITTAAVAAAAAAAATTISAPAMTTANELANVTTGANKEERESISNAVASLPPAQVSF